MPHYLWKRWPQGSLRAVSMASQQMAQSSSLAASSSAVATANLEKINKTVMWRANRYHSINKMRKENFFLPGLHVVDDAEVIFVTANTPLDFMEKVSQLHEDHQARHGQPNVTKKLMGPTSKPKKLETLEKEKCRKRKIKVMLNHTSMWMWCMRSRNSIANSMMKSV